MKSGQGGTEPPEAVILDKVVREGTEGLGLEYFQWREQQMQRIEGAISTVLEGLGRNEGYEEGFVD